MLNLHWQCCSHLNIFIHIIVSHKAVCFNRDFSFDKMFHHQEQMLIITTIVSTERVSYMKTADVNPPVLPECGGFIYCITRSIQAGIGGVVCV